MQPQGHWGTLVLEHPATTQNRGIDMKKLHGYELKEPTVGDVPGLFDLLTGEKEAPTNTVIRDMLRNCVLKDGQPLGDDISNIPLSKVKDLVNELTEMSGLLGDKEKK